MNVQQQAQEALDRWDAARKELREAENQLRKARSAFGSATGVHGIGPEGMRFALQQQKERDVA